MPRFESWAGFAGDGPGWSRPKFSSSVDAVAKGAACASTWAIVFTTLQLLETLAFKYLFERHVIGSVTVDGTAELRQLAHLMRISAHTARTIARLGQNTVTEIYDIADETDHLADRLDGVAMPSKTTDGANGQAEAG